VKNLSEILYSEQAGTVTRWHLPSVQNYSSVDAQPVVGAQLHTAEHLDALEQSAWQEGLERGQAEGYAAGLAAARADAERLRQLLDHMTQPLRELNEEVERSLIHLTVSVARKLVNAELEMDPALVSGAVHEAVTALSAVTREMKVHMHPEDVRLLTDNQVTLPTDTPWKLVPDSSLHRGDCRVITDTGRVDARLDTRQANITSTLLSEDA
jgi:flagellar assembly protein FliH